MVGPNTNPVELRISADNINRHDQGWDDLRIVSMAMQLLAPYLPAFETPYISFGLRRSFDFSISLEGINYTWKAFRT